jgi:hypothetical protein
MNWLSMNKAQMNCFAKTITLHGLDGRKIMFKEEKNIISVMTARKIMKKG